MFLSKNEEKDIFQIDLVNYTNDWKSWDGQMIISGESVGDWDKIWIANVTPDDKRRVFSFIKSNVILIVCYS